MELTGSNHNQLEQYENRAHHFTVVQLNIFTQLLAEKKLEAKQKSWKKNSQVMSLCHTGCQYRNNLFEVRRVNISKSIRVFALLKLPEFVFFDDFYIPPGLKHPGIFFT
jgi:hypothetical protein